MLKKARKVLRSNNGFTILELIVVIAIMGFLIALVAPKLANVADNTKEPIAVTDMKRLSEVVQRNIQETGYLPNYLNDLIPIYQNNVTARRVRTGGGLSIWKQTPIPSNTGHGWTWNGNKDNPSIFLKKFYERNNPHLHNLSKDEADEIKKLGITEIISLETGKPCEVKENTRVLMIGAGSTSTGNPSKPYRMTMTDFNNNSIWNMESKKGYSYARPELIYRIVLGISEGNELIERGLLKDVGIHPKGLANKDYIKFTNYSLVLPRLQATIDRLGNGAITEPVESKYANDKYATDTPTLAHPNRFKSVAEITVSGYDEEGKPIEKAKNRVINLTEAQEMSAFAIIGIGDEVYPINEAYEWKIEDGKLKGGGTLKADLD